MSYMLKMADRRVKTEWKFGTGSSRNCICKVLSCLILWVQFGVIRALAKYLMLKFWFFKMPFQTNVKKSSLYGMGGGGYRLFNFLAICQIKKYKAVCEIWLTRDHMVLEISRGNFKAPRMVFILPNFVRTYRRIPWQAKLFLENLPNIKNIRHFGNKSPQLHCHYL